MQLNSRSSITGYARSIGVLDVTSSQTDSESLSFERNEIALVLMFSILGLSPVAIPRALRRASLAPLFQAETGIELLPI
jgi:hypothetical protein